MNTLEEIFSKHLIKLLPDIHESVCSDLINNKSRSIIEVPQLSCWLKYYRNSKSVLYGSIINALSTTDNASLFIEQLSFYLLPQKERYTLIVDEINEIYSYSAEDKKIQSEAIDYKKRLKKDSDALLNENYDNISRDKSRSFISSSVIQFFS